MYDFIEYFLVLTIKKSIYFLSFLKFRCIQLKQAIDENKNALQKLNKVSISDTDSPAHLFHRCLHAD